MATPISLPCAVVSSRLKTIRIAIKILFVLAVLFFADLARAQNAPARGSRQFPPGTITKTEDLPPGKFRTRLEGLPEKARNAALERLNNFHFTELDLDSLAVDEEGGVLYIDHFALAADRKSTRLNSS